MSNKPETLVFNSYTVFDKEGHLIMDERLTKGTSEAFFNGLPSVIRRRAHVMLVLREDGIIEKYMVEQPTVPVPTLGQKESLRRT